MGFWAWTFFIREDSNKADREPEPLGPRPHDVLNGAEDPVCDAFLSQSAQQGRHVTDVVEHQPARARRKRWIEPGPLCQQSLPWPTQYSRHQCGQNCDVFWSVGNRVL